MAKLPTTEEIDAAAVALESYFSALGKVAHAWNHMQEELGKLFCRITGLELSMAMAIWQSLKSDRSQRDLLAAAVECASWDDRWSDKYPQAKKAIDDLLEAINRFSNKRNAAIHAPCSVVPGENDVEIFAVSFFGNQNAMKLRGKDILAEFSWYERTADTYRLYIRDIQFAVSGAPATWPDKPVLPTQGQKNSPRDQPRR